MEGYELTEEKYYWIKRGLSDLEPECVVKLETHPDDPDDNLYRCIRYSDKKDVYIGLYRFVKEITPENNPEYFL